MHIYVADSKTLARLDRFDTAQALSESLGEDALKRVRG